MTTRAMPQEPQIWWHDGVTYGYVNKLRAYAQEGDALLAKATKDSDHFFKLSGEYLDKLAEAERRADEMQEKCAKVCDQWSKRNDDVGGYCAAAIRALKECGK